MGRGRERIWRRDDKGGLEGGEKKGKTLWGDCFYGGKEETEYKRRKVMGEISGNLGWGAGETVTTTQDEHTVQSR